jgi:dTDP-L-rhamnose 4-epimerase
VKLRNVLVTGGAGFIGCALSQKLASKADRWVAFDSLHPQVHSSKGRPSDLHEAAELIVGDVTVAEDWMELLSDFTPDLVIHLAAETGTAQSMFESSRHALVNVVGTTRMFDALGEAGVRPERILLTSSRAVYGEGRWADSAGEFKYPGIRSKRQLDAGEWDFAGLTPIPSDVIATWPRPTSIYGATKLDQEHLLASWGAANGSRVTVLRLQNVFGPGQSLTNPYTGIVSLFSQLARAGQSIPIYEDGHIVRDFVVIDDVVSAISAALSWDQRSMVETFDVGSGVASTIENVASWLSEYYGAPSPHVTGQFREGDVRHASCSIERTKSTLNWTPNFSVSDGLESLQEWLGFQLGTGLS